jgi:hypothetical protein
MGGMVIPKPQCSPSPFSLSDHDHSILFNNPTQVPFHFQFGLLFTLLFLFSHLRSINREVIQTPKTFKTSPRSYFLAQKWIRYN